MTFSIGVLTCDRGGVSVDEVMRGADALLYQAKAEGKDTIRSGTLARPAGAFPDLR